METRKQAHSVYHCLYHIVWITRYRHKVLVNNVIDYLSKKLLEVRKTYPEIIFIEKNIQPNHVHLVITFPPKYSISRIVQILKSNTAKSVRNKFEFIQNRYRGGTGIWSTGYFVSTVGLDEETIKAYVRYQAKEDSGQAKLALSVGRPRA